MASHSKLRYYFSALLVGTLFSGRILAQDYHAIEGSPYAGSLGTANNPASILLSPYSWDLTVFSVEETNTTNALTLHDYSLLSQGKSIVYQWNNGNYPRYLATSFNVHLFNLRIKLGNQQAIAFGANLQSYSIAKTSRFNYNDSLTSFSDFFGINHASKNTYGGSFASTSWLELTGTYSRTFWDDASSRLNGGMTLKITNGISGAYAQVNNGTVEPVVAGGQSTYYLEGGAARYGYSSNYDYWHNYQSTGKNLRDFLTHTRIGAAIDLGVEYLIKEGAASSTDNDEEEDALDYNWKIGVSLLDLGENIYKNGSQSLTASDPLYTTANQMQSKFSNFSSVAAFNDTVKTIAQNTTQNYGSFAVLNPARMVINVDHPLGYHFFVNGDLAVNLSPSNTGATKRFYSKEISLFTLTPRWETRKLGVYLPVQVTQQGQIWVGGAFKAGPLLMGVHNWGNLLSRNKMANGGFYIALVIRPHKSDGSEKEAKMYTCPKL